MRSLIKAAEWILGLETAQGAPQEPLYESQCTTCHDTSEAIEGDKLLPEIWAIKHTGLHPTHRTFRAITTGFWRVDPAPGNPLYEEERRKTLASSP